MLRITVWNENVHEKVDPEVAALYPNGIHGAVAAALGTESDFTIRTATLDEPECGLTEDVLESTDVLFWWGHRAHNDVPDEIVDRVQRHVLRGMGLVVLHSGHNSKIFKRLCGTSCSLDWHYGSRERIFAINPAHPIAQGLPPYFELSEEECYAEPFGIPEPDELVFIGWYNTGEVFRSGCCFYRGNGRMFYFQPGHETYGIYYDPNIRQVLRNAARWAAPVVKTAELVCHNTAPLETV